MKPFILFALLSMIVFVSPCQSWEDLYKQTQTYWGKDWEKSSEILEKALVAAKEEFGEHDSVYAVTLNYLGSSYLNQGRYHKARPFLEEGLDKIIYLHGKEHHRYGRVCMNLGRLYSNIGEYELALPLLLDALENTKQTVGESHKYYEYNLTDLGMLYNSLSKFEEAKWYFEQTLLISEKYRGKDHPIYGTWLNNLGALHQIMGNLDKALPIYQESLTHAEKNFGKNHIEYSIRLNNLGNFYRESGDYDRALPLFEKAIQLMEKNNLRHHYQYGQILNNYSGTFMDMREFDQALPIAIQALNHTDSLLGTEHSDYGVRLNMVAQIHRLKGNYDKALELFEQSRINAEKSVGKQHSYYGTVLSNIGFIHLQQQQPQKALPYFLASRDIVKEVLGQHHEDSNNDLSHLARVYEQLGEDEQAASTYHELMEGLSDQLSSQFTTLDERLQLSSLQLKSRYFNQFNSFLYDHPDVVQIHADGYDQQLMLKGFLQSQRVDMLQSSRQNTDTALQRVFLQWQSLHRQLSRQFQKPIDQRISYMDSLQEQADRLEVYLANQSLPFRKARKKVSWTDVRSSLSDREAAIEFAHFPYNDQGIKTGRIQYIAFLIRPQDSLPHMIPLFDEKQFEQAFVGDAPQQTFAQLYQYRGIKPRKKAETNYQSLYEQVWQPIDSFLSEVETIYFAPSGILNRINMGAIPINKRELLADQYHLVQLGSTRNIALSHTATSSPSQRNSLLMGGITYARDSQSDQTDFQTKEEGNFFNSESSPYTRGQQNWPYLDGTYLEVNQIHQLLQRNQYASQLFTDQAARESLLKQLDTSPYLLHIATHGYFFPPQTENLDKDSLLPIVARSDHPMVRSGLILAGANHAWKGNPVPEGEEDGILTAYEISRMDLSNTELVVLSACETGLGDIQGNEGVYGLQRAFKIAGAKYILMSLWQVPDQATQELMTVFYEKWLDGMEIREALQEAQKQMRKKYKEAYYWAGFVLVE